MSARSHRTDDSAETASALANARHRNGKARARRALAGSLATSLLALLAGCSAIVSTPRTHTPVEPKDFGRTFSQAELAEELRFARQVIEEVHPRPRQRMSSDAMDALVAELTARIDRPMTRTEFWPIAAELAASLGDAHTSVGTPGEEWTYFLSQGGRLLPFAFGVKEGGIVVSASRLGAEGPPVGARLRRVDDVDVEVLVAAYLRERAGDPDFVLAGLAGGLHHHLWRVGARAPFDVVVDVVVDGESGPVTYSAIAGATYAELSQPPAPSSAAQATAAVAKPANWTLAWLEGDVALVDFRSMRDLQAWESFLESTFAELAKRDAKGLIVDLRANGGGDSSLGTALLAYLTDRPFRACARKEWRASARYRQHMKDHVVWWLRWMPLQWLHPVGRKMWGVEEGGIAVFEIEPEAPERKELRYRGPWCLLIGPSTFSSAMMLANMVGDYELAPLFGSETGGAPNDCGEVYSCDLPHTRLELHVSSAYFVRANGDGDDPRGVLPTFEVVRSPVDVAAGRDTVLEVAKAWILAREAAP